MRKALLIGTLFFVVIMTSGCSFLAPNISKAQTEKEQLEAEKEQTEVQKQQTIELKRIADALETIANKE